MKLEKKFAKKPIARYVWQRASRLRKLGFNRLDFIIIALLTLFYLLFF